MEVVVVRVDVVPVPLDVVVLPDVLDDDVDDLAGTLTMVNHARE